MISSTWTEHIRKFSLVCPDTGCWIWQRSKNRGGYGRQRVGNRTISAHILSYTAFKGSYPKNLVVMHKCDRRDCVNPDHLVLGTHQDNIDDAVSKDRHARGERVNTAKITKEEVLNIKRLRQKGLTLREIGIEVGLSKGQISKILNGNCWSHVKESP